MIPDLACAENEQANKTRTGTEKRVAKRSKYMIQRNNVYAYRYIHGVCVSDIYDAIYTKRTKQK
jgi:hypothetical protein